MMQPCLTPIPLYIITDNQGGFRKAQGTRDHIANMRWIMERQLEYGKEVYICFIDCINHELLWKTLLEMGIPKHLRLYEDQSAVIRTEFGDTDRLKIKKGVASCPHSYSTCVLRG